MSAATSVAGKKKAPRTRGGAASPASPVRVAIVGGGCAAMTAAFELSRPEHRGRYEITLYQLGWRLGGKGASGRGEADRIEEHGLHLWMGFYENAFRVMRETYAELGRDRRTCHIATWDDAFKPAPDVGVVDRAGDAAWEAWVAHFPPGRGLPGDPIVDRGPLSVQGYLLQASSLVVELLRSAHARAPAAGPSPSPPCAPASAPKPAVDSLIGTIETILRYGQLATATALFEAADLLRAALHAMSPRDHGGGGGVLLQLVDAIARAAQRNLQLLVGGDGALRRVWQVIDLILAILRGAIVHGLALDPRGFDAIDDHDWRAWLRLHGASPSSLDSGFMRGIYDLAFAYEGGDPARPSLSAAVALRGAMRMFFTYRGALFWRMSAGMGDIVFAPLYEVLHRRGVRFEFFHRLRDVKLGEAAPGQPPHVAELHLDVQARTTDGAEYRPLVDVRGLPCWPSSPDWSQLDGGARMKRERWRFEAHTEDRRAGTKRLRVGRDFDAVVLGVSIGAIPHVAPDLCAREPRWRAMVDHVRSVGTQAFQLWMNRDMRGLGWRGPAANVSGFVEPFDTWADMSHLLPEESWRAPVRSIAYFCSVLPDPGTPESAADPAHHRAQRARVRDNAVRFLDRDIAALWPDAATPADGFRWEVLACDAEREDRAARGPARFDSQFWTANTSPSERYVLSLPGTSRYRLSPLDMSFDNLTIAGDWTETGLNTGCVESAVISGMLAAHALAGSPRLEDIIGYDHP